MARQPRFDVPDILYHIINRGNGRQDVFHSKNDRIEYLELIKRYKERYPITLYHYVLMTNHVHFLLESTREGALPAFMHDLTLAHTVRFNQKRKTVGHVWQGRYKSIPIDRDEYFLQCGRYIELNPVRAKLVSHPSEYPWSSYHVYATGAQSGIVDVHPFYDELGNTPTIRQCLYVNDIERELESTLRKDAVRFSERQIYGSELFIKKLKEQHGFSPLRERPGRPRKGT